MPSQTLKSKDSVTSAERLARQKLWDVFLNSITKYIKDKSGRITGLKATLPAIKSMVSALDSYFNELLQC